MCHVPYVTGMLYKARKFALGCPKGGETGNQWEASYIWAMYYFRIFTVFSLRIGRTTGAKWIRSSNLRYYRKNIKHYRCTNLLKHIFHRFYHHKRAVIQGVLICCVQWGLFIWLTDICVLIEAWQGEEAAILVFLAVVEAKGVSFKRCGGHKGPA